jgi:hypothetical protein
MSSDKKGQKPDYEVGYRRPPKEHQFKRGRGGNPSGQRKRPITADEALQHSLNEMVRITEGGRQKRAPAILVVYRQVVALAMRGDVRAAKFILSQLPKTAASNAEFDFTSLSDDEARELERLLTKASPKTP